MFVDFSTDIYRENNTTRLRRNLVSTHPIRNKKYRKVFVKSFHDFKLIAKLEKLENKMNSTINYTDLEETLERYDIFITAVRNEPGKNCGKSFKPTVWSVKLIKQNKLLKYWKIISRFKKHSSEKCLKNLNPNHPIPLPLGDFCKKINVYIY